MNMSTLFKPIYYGALTIFVSFMALFFVVLLPDDFIRSQTWLGGHLIDTLTADGTSREGRGEYLAFLVGVPLAAAASVIAALIAQASHEVAHRQQQIQTSDFLDSKLSGRLEGYVDILSAFDRLYEIGWEMHARYAALDQWCGNCSARFERAIFEGEDPGSTLDEREFRTVVREWAADVAPFIEDIGAQMDIIVENFLSMTIDPFWGAAFEHQTADEKDWDKAFTEIIGARQTPRRLARTSRWIAYRLRSGSKNNEIAVAGYHAYRVVPHDRNDLVFPLAFVGAMLELADEKGRHITRSDLDHRRDAPDVTITEVRNSGAAAIVAMFNAVPQSGAFLAAVKEIFPTLDLREFKYFRRMPSKSKISSDEMDAACAAVSEDAGLLIYEVTSGQGKISGSFKRARNDSLPKGNASLGVRTGGRFLRRQQNQESLPAAGDNSPATFVPSYQGGVRN